MEIENTILEKILSELQGLKQGQDELGQRIDNLEQGQKGFEHRFDVIDVWMNKFDQRLDSVENRLDTLESEVKHINVTIEEDVMKQIARLAEASSGHTELLDVLSINVNDILERLDVMTVVQNLHHKELGLAK